MLLFSTDYPHWHFDGKDALPDGLPDHLLRKILVDNALKTYPSSIPVSMESRPMNVTVMDRQARYIDADQARHRRLRCASLHEVAGRLSISSCRSAGASIAASIGGRSRAPFANAPNYPRMSPFTGMRMDSWPKDGTHPGSDLEMMQEQLLDLFNVSYGLMMPLLGGAVGRAQRRVRRGDGDRGERVGSAGLVRPRAAAEGAVCRSRSNITEAAIKEIEKRAGDRRFTHVMIPPRGLEPLGRRRYWPILEACAANGFPIALHLGGTSGHPSTGGGWPSFYHEEHPSYPQSKEALVTCLVIEGVFEHIPNLRVALVEGGFAWLPSLSWRLDKHYKRLHEEVPHLKKLPSEYIRAEHLGDDAADRGAGTAGGPAGDAASGSAGTASCSRPTIRTGTRTIRATPSRRR